jgi:voltage-gated potassium channel
MTEMPPPLPSSAPNEAPNGRWLSTFATALRGDPAAWKAIRHKVYTIIEVGRGDDRASKIFDGIIICLIIANIAAFMAETVQDINARYGPYLRAFELFCVAVFTLEYLARLWTAVEVPFLSRMGPWQARMRFARRPYLIIDLLAVLPFYLSFLIPIDTRVLRVLRLLRFFKLSRYSPAMHTLIRVLSNERRSLMGAGLLLTAAVLISSTIMYYLENEAQPDKFSSVPETAYWAITTLTTVGYGDLSPVTSFGKVWAAMTMIFGLCVLALPVAIISTGFAQEVGRRDFVVTWSLMARIPLLAELDTTEVAAIMPLLHANNLPPHSEVIAANSPGDAMYFIAAGAVELNANGRKARYDTGDFFGAVALLENGQNPGSFKTVAKSRLLKIYRDDFHRLEVINPNIGAHVRRVAAERRKQRDAYDQAQVQEIVEQL